MHCHRDFPLLVSPLLTRPQQYLPGFPTVNGSTVSPQWALYEEVTCKQWGIYMDASVCDVCVPIHFSLYISVLSWR